MRYKLQTIRCKSIGKEQKTKSKVQRIQMYECFCLLVFFTSCLLLLTSYLSPTAYAQDEAPAVKFFSGSAYFLKGYDLDILYLALDEDNLETPKITKYSNPTRFVVDLLYFKNAEELKRLLEDKYGNCVQKIELQSFKKHFLVLYVYPDVEMELSSLGNGLWEFNFYHLRKDKKLYPINIVKDIRFMKDKNSEKEVLFISTSLPLNPSIYEVDKDNSNSRRLIITFSNSVLSDQFNSSKIITRGDLLIDLEILGLGSQPDPYLQMDEAREYNFVGVPSPMAYDFLLRKNWGKQERKTLLVLYVEDEVNYELKKRNDNLFIITFSRQKKVEDTAITTCSPLPAEQPQTEEKKTDLLFILGE